MSVILRRYVVIRSCFGYQTFSSNQNEIRRSLTTSKFLQFQTKKEVAPSTTENDQQGQLQTSFAKKAHKGKFLPK